MRKNIKYILLILFLGILCWLTIWVVLGYSEKKVAKNRIRILPASGFLSLNNQSVNLLDYKNYMSFVLIYFHPECEHCEYEAREIGQNSTAFKHCQIIMVTPDDSIRRVKDFCTKHHLWELENFEVLLDQDNQFKKVFGKAIIPSIYIYDKDRKLKKYFLGETKPEAIINEIQE